MIIYDFLVVTRIRNDFKQAIDNLAAASINNYEILNAFILWSVASIIYDFFISYIDQVWFLWSHTKTVRTRQYVLICIIYDPCITSNMTSFNFLYLHSKIGRSRWLRICCVYFLIKFLRNGLSKDIRFTISVYSKFCTIYNVMNLKLLAR